MITVKRVDSQNEDFKTLVNQLNSYLAVVDGEDHDFYNQFNKMEHLTNCIVIYDNDIPIGCGALKKFDATAFEIKRMFVHTSQRGKGIASRILKELEQWSLELKATHCVLETGKRMPDAVALYQKNGYTKISNYGPYIGVENSICFKKELRFL